MSRSTRASASEKAWALGQHPRREREVANAGRLLKAAHRPEGDIGIGDGGEAVRGAEDEGREDHARASLRSGCSQTARLKGSARACRSTAASSFVRQEGHLGEEAVRTDAADGREGRKLRPRPGDEHRRAVEADPIALAVGRDGDVAVAAVDVPERLAHCSHSRRRSAASTRSGAPRALRKASSWRRSENEPGAVRCDCWMFAIVVFGIDLSLAEHRREHVGREDRAGRGEELAAVFLPVERIAEPDALAVEEGRRDARALVRGDGDAAPVAVAGGHGPVEFARGAGRRRQERLMRERRRRQHRRDRRPHRLADPGRLVDDEERGGRPAQRQPAQHVGPVAGQAKGKAAAGGFELGLRLAPELLAAGEEKPVELAEQEATTG